jgi:hypothetical protein
MSDDKGMSGAEIAQVFGALGRIEQKIDTHTQWMTSHVAENKALEADVRKLEIGAARQKGVMAALAGVGSLLGAGVGYAVDLVTRGNH